MESLKDVRELRKDAKGAVWAFLVINVFAVFFWLVVSPLDEIAFVLVFVQIAFLIVWLLPYFLYQVVVLKRNLKYAFFKTLGSYKDLWANFTY